MTPQALGPDALHRLLEPALGLAGADDVEALAHHTWGGLTRFAASQVHQNVASEDTSIAVRVATGGRVGAATTNDVTPEGVAHAARQALAAARLSPPDPMYPGLGGPFRPAAVDRFDPATAEASPAGRAAAVGELVGRLATGQEAAGAVTTTAVERALANTAGAAAYGAHTRASAATVVMAGTASGHHEQTATRFDDLDVGEVGRRAAATCAAAVDPAPVEPGTYEVVLLPAAVATWLQYLSYTTFGAKAVREGRSAFADRLGQEVASPMVTIADDALAPGALGIPWDEEGTPTRRVELVRAGVANAVVHDRTTAAAEGLASTGHGLPPPNPMGPLARHLVVEPGDATVDDLLAGIDHGLVVSRFWYTRVVHPKRTLVTGMTRDGTFRVEGGQRAGPVRSLRFNDSILAALAACDGVGDTLHSHGDDTFDIRVPALRIRELSFSSASDH